MAGCAATGVEFGLVVLFAILLAVWVAHPRVSGTYYGYIDGKKNVKIVIEKDGKNKKLGYLQYVSTTDTGRAIKRLTKALDRNNQVISELADKDSTALEAKNLMNSKLYKDYLTEAKIPMQAVKHKGKWYLQYQSALFKEAGYSQSDIKDFTKDLYGNGTYSKENELAPGWRKMTVGTGEKYFLFYRGSKEPNKPQDWAASMTLESSWILWTTWTIRIIRLMKGRPLITAALTRLIWGWMTLALFLHLLSSA